MSFKRLGLLSLNRCEIDLSNEVLNIDFGQGAAKISEVKFGGQKKFLPISPARTRAPGIGCWQIFFLNSNFDL